MWIVYRIADGDFWYFGSWETADEAKAEANEYNRCVCRDEDADDLEIRNMPHQRDGYIKRLQSAHK